MMTGQEANTEAAEVVEAVVVAVADAEDTMEKRAENIVQKASIEAEEAAEAEVAVVDASEEKKVREEKVLSTKKVNSRKENTRDQDLATMMIATMASQLIMPAKLVKNIILTTEGAERAVEDMPRKKVSAEEAGEVRSKCTSARVNQLPKENMTRKKRKEKHLKEESASTETDHLESTVKGEIVEIVEIVVIDAMRREKKKSLLKRKKRRKKA